MVIKKKSILIIDDDPDFTFLARSILEAKGMEVTSVGALKDARTRLETDVPNIILLDMELKNEHGVDFLKERSTNPLWAQIPVVVCSSQNLAAVVKTAIRYGADDYLLKPIKQTWLIQRIRKNLIKEDSKEFFFDEGEEVEVLVEAETLAFSKSNFIARASIGFEKGTLILAQIPQPDGGEPIISQFKANEKSRFSSRGPFDTVFSSVTISESEKKRIQLLKTFWKP